MGYLLPAAKMLMEVGVSHPLSGRVLQLGRQDIFFGQEALEKAAADVGYALRRVDPEPLVANQFLGETDRVITDRYFFRQLGFDEVWSLDISEFESASILFDLNELGVPDQHANSFDVIVDGGTLEHVFHLPHALKNITDFLKVGGLVVHSSPAHNFYQHGFFAFSPTFFHDFYSVNNFEIICSQLLRYNPRKKDPGYERTILLPDNVAVRELNRVGSLDDRCYTIFFVARKTHESTGTNIPQQSAYVEKWPETQESVGQPAAYDSALHVARPLEKSVSRRVAKKIAKKNSVAMSLFNKYEKRLFPPRIPWEKI